MQFSRFTTAVVALALITLAIAAGGAAIGAAQEETESEWDELVNSSIETTENTTYVELDVEFAETFENTSEETVELTLYDEGAYDASGDLASEDYEDSLAGTEFTLNTDVQDGAVYHVELDASATTVEVDAAEFTEGSVDLSTQTEDTIEADDTVVSVEIVAPVVLEDTVTGTPGETVNNEYNLSDTALEIDSEYRAIVEVENENNIESGFVAADDEAVGGATFGSADAVPGFGAGVAVAAVALGTALLARARAGGS